jgi:hypothetical protein
MNYNYGRFNDDVNISGCIVKWHDNELNDVYEKGYYLVQTGFIFRAAAKNDWENPRKSPVMTADLWTDLCTQKCYSLNPLPVSTFRNAFLTSEYLDTTLNYRPH